MASDAAPVRTPDAPHFTVVVLPDTQVYTRENPEPFEAQTRWIARAQERENVAFVVHEGDLVDSPAAEQFERADAALDHLDDAGVPYLVAIGNHDYDDVGERDATAFESRIPVARFAGADWWGGSYDGTAYNAYAEFEALGERYLVLSIELFPREAVLEWATELLSEHPAHDAMVVTHGYLYHDATPIDTGDQWDRTSYGLAGHNGDELWEAFLGRHDPVWLVFSGHVLTDGGARLTTPGAGGPVHQLLTNFQSRGAGGEGYLRLVRVFPSEGTLTVETYSPYLEQYHPDPDLHFRIEDAFGGGPRRTVGSFVSYRGE